jgi:Response regulator containing CheY-like receiver, AAA-type ATPase, and DNA-binding domains
MVEVPRVLIADGDATLRQQLFTSLLNLDVYSDLVSTTADALQSLTEHEYGVVVVDVALPFGDVERVIAHIENMPAAMRPVVLVLAANPESARSLDVEIVQIVLRRPVNLPQLVDVVRSCIRSHARARDGVVTEPGRAPRFR